MLFWDFSALPVSQLIHTVIPNNLTLNHFEADSIILDVPLSPAISVRYMPKESTMIEDERH